MKISFSFKVLFGVLGIGLMLLTSMLYYTYNQNQKLMIEHLKSQEELISKNISHTITLDMKQLSQEVKFLSRLRVMDDLLADDMDMRILKLLEVKKETLKFDADFKVLSLQKKLLVTTTRKLFDVKQGVLFQKPLFASFDKEKSLGYLQLYLPLKYLDMYLAGHPHMHVSMKKEDRQAPNKDELFHLRNEISVGNGQFLVLHSSVLKSRLQQQLSPLKQNLFMLALLIITLLFLAAYLLSQSITKPIRQLSNLMKNVSNGESYHLRNNIKRDDEIGHLSQSFNSLLDVIEQKIVHIQNESENRMQQFTDLVESFNQITKQQDGKGINQALKEVKKFSSHHQGSTDSFLNAVETLASLQHERIALQETQIKLLEEATRLAEDRRNFVTQVSHEFKTPLNSIIGFSQFIDQEKLLPENYATLVTNIESAGKHLLLLVNQVLDISHENEKQNFINIDSIDLNNLLQAVCELLYPQTQKSGIKIKFQHSSSYIIKTDRRMFKQVCINLLANAIKFSNHHDITLSISHRDEFIAIHIKDEGIGMDKNALNTLFTPFVRLSNAKNIKGTGLGLALAQSYMQKLGGTIVATSAGLNKGSEFIIKVDKSKCVSC